MKRLKINNSIKSVLAGVIIAAGVSLSPLPASADGDDLNLNTSGTNSSTVKNIIVGLIRLLLHMIKLKMIQLLKFLQKKDL